MLGLIEVGIYFFCLFVYVENNGNNGNNEYKVYG